MVSTSRLRETEERRGRLEGELAALRAERSAKWQEYIAFAREDGATDGVAADLRQVVALLDLRIDRLNEALSSVGAEEADSSAPGVVGVGSRVRVRWPEGEEDLFTVVSPPESDPGRGDLSCEAPLGQALLGSRAGDMVEVQAPDGPLLLQVLSVG